MSSTAKTKLNNLIKEINAVPRTNIKIEGLNSILSDIRRLDDDSLKKLLEKITEIAQRVKVYIDMFTDLDLDIQKMNDALTESRLRLDRLSSRL